MFLALRKRMADGLLVVADISGGLLCGSAAVVVAILGKAMLAVVLGAVALGFFLRLASRRGLPTAVSARLGFRYQVPSFLLAAVEVAFLTEAINLPVRFDQPGFQPGHWILVVVALAVAHAFHMRACRKLFGEHRVASQR